MLDIWKRKLESVGLAGVVHMASPWVLMFLNMAGALILASGILVRNFNE